LADIYEATHSKLKAQESLSVDLKHSVIVYAGCEVGVVCWWKDLLGDRLKVEDVQGLTF
tara:strand:- start:89 stop:265 length:177 start_codon:yes stop_codon:yes gene_type:complete